MKRVLKFTWWVPLIPLAPFIYKEIQRQIERRKRPKDTAA